ncbi:hypothetical protein yfred0001_36560 [Yersinia frederiksenii ATCC 33641]|nr:hypothetical protein yfred0001_36560 [Yersinia frederiksenii ATCC 33641]
MLSIFAATYYKSRSDDDSDDNGPGTLIKSTSLNAKCFFFISTLGMTALIG